MLLSLSITIRAKAVQHLKNHEHYSHLLPQVRKDSPEEEQQAKAMATTSNDNRFMVRFEVTLQRNSVKDKWARRKGSGCKQKMVRSEWWSQSLYWSVCPCGLVLDRMRMD